MTKLHHFYTEASKLLNRYSVPTEKDPLKDFKFEVLHQLTKTVLDSSVDGKNVPSSFELQHSLPVNCKNIIDTVEKVFADLPINVQHIRTEVFETRKGQIAHLTFVTE